MVVADDVPTLGQPEGYIGSASVRFVRQMASCARHELPKIFLGPDIIREIRHLEMHFLYAVVGLYAQKPPSHPNPSYGELRSIAVRDGRRQKHH